MQLDTVSRESEAKLERYAELVRHWQFTINLISPNSVADLEDRHIRDSLQLCSYIPPTAKHLFDFGSGGGFPGMVIALARPDISCTLIESDQRKCSFLKTVSRETKTPVSVVNNRVELYQSGNAPDVITARALSSLDRLFELSLRFAQANPALMLLFLKGERADFEIEEAQKHFDFKLDTYPSMTDEMGRILQITQLSGKS